MNFSTLLNQLKKLDLPDREYVIISSGSLAARGIREANNFDILVTEKLWNKLRQVHSLTKTIPVENIDIGDMQIIGHGSVFRDSEIASVEEIINTADIIGGVRFINLKFLKQFKLKEAKDKDLKDVKLIDDYLKETI